MRRFIAALLVVVLGLFATACAVPEEGKDSQGKAASDSKNKGDKDKGDEPEKAKPEMTSGQENALEAAENYLDFAAFSQQGLIRQLSSPAGDGYSKADATFAANNVDADWNAEAVEAAEGYLEIMPMSKDGLIQQLTSSAGDQFTQEQAQYAANKVL